MIVLVQEDVTGLPMIYAVDALQSTHRKEIKMAAKTKITLDSVIKGYAKKKGRGCFSIKVGDVKLTEAKRNKLDGLIDDAEKVKLTIEPVQEQLPGME